MHNHNKPVHNKARGMVKESSRERFMHEQKEIEHEFNENKTTIMKLMNDRFTYYDTRKQKNDWVIRFQNPDDKSMRKVTCHFEANYEHLKPLWTPDTR